MGGSVGDGGGVGDSGLGMYGVVGSGGEWVADRGREGYVVDRGMYLRGWLMEECGVGWGGGDTY